MSAAATLEEIRPVLLIDLSAIFRAAFHANETGPTGITLTATIEGVRRAEGMVPGCLVGVCCDGRGNWRKALSPTYKAHREKQPESMWGQLDRVKAQLIADGYLLWTADGYEADDVIAGAAAAARAAGHDVVIASHDKDVCQLVSANVRMLKTSTWEILGPAEVVAKFGVEPEGVGDWLALVGDKSDGVEGIPSIGPKTASALLIQHGGLDGIFRAVSALPIIEGSDGAPQVATKTPEAAKVATPAVVDKLWRFEKQARLARELVTLKTDAPIRFEDIYNKREVVTTMNSGNVNLDAEDDVPISRPPVAAAPAGAAASPASAPEAAPSSSSAPSSATAAKTEPATSVEPASHVTETALAVRLAAPLVEVTYERQLEPRSAQAALTLGEVLHQSRAFSRYPTPQAITAAIMSGRELGFPAMASLNMFQFLAELGCLAPKAHTIIELGIRHPKCKYFRLVESTYELATYETWHTDHPELTRHTYTIQDAVDAGLATLVMVPRMALAGQKDTRGQWDKRRKQMLRKTCGTQLVTIVYPGASMGMIAAEELRDMGDEDEDE